MLPQIIQRSGVLFNAWLFYFPVAIYIIASYHVLSLEYKIGEFFLPEDHFFESVGAVSFFITALLFSYGFWALRSFKPAERSVRIKRGVLLALALAFFFAAGEEISWGQRIFQVQTPQALDQINVQGEITLHNIDIGSWEIPFETLFDLMWGFLAFFVPLVSLYQPIGKLTFRLMPVSHWGVGLLFLLNYLWAKVPKLYYLGSYSFSMPFVQAVQEIKEGNYAFLFVFFALSSLVLMPELAQAKKVDHSIDE